MSEDKRSITCYRTKELGYIIVVIRITKGKAQSNIVILLDPWKVGIRDFLKHNGSLSDLKTKLGNPRLELHEIPKKQAAQLLAQSKQINDALHFPISPEASKWLQSFGIPKIQVSGSIYKCFSCEQGELKQDEVEEILKIAKEEIETAQFGKKDEKQYYFVCDECRTKAQQLHQH